MLPFVFLDETKLGPFHPYGICCALGFFAWDWAVMRQARRKGLDERDFRVLTIALLVVGTLFAWGVDAVFYHPPGRSVTSTLLSFQGFSSTGGLVGATIAGLVWRYVWIGREDGRLRVRRRAEPQRLLPVSDVIVSTWPLAWAFGRLGCALIHDHPGVTVAKGTLASLFALAWPLGPTDGVHHVLGPLHVVTGGSQARFDLGLLELVVLAAIALGFAATWKRDLRPGTYTIIGTLVYGPIRFGLDFLRMSDGPGGDLRHGGLTFAQYFSLAIVGLGLTLLAQRRRRPAPAAALVTVAMVAAGATLAWPSRALAAPRWIDRPMTLPQLVFAGDLGLGVGHGRFGRNDFTGPGLNLEGAVGITDSVELGLRTGVRVGDDARVVGADAYGRTLWTETWGVAGDTVANPEARVRWTFYSGDVAEVGLGGRVYLPIEDNSRFGMMFGVPLAFHLGSILRIDTGAYVPVVFYDDAFTAISVPAYFWFQTSERVWLGPMAALRWIDNGPGPSNTNLLLGFGLGYQASSAVDLKTMLLFPQINRDEGARNFGVGFGVQFRVE